MGKLPSFFSSFDNLGTPLKREEKINFKQEVRTSSKEHTRLRCGALWY